MQTINSQKEFENEAIGKNLLHLAGLGLASGENLQSAPGLNESLVGFVSAVFCLEQMTTPGFFENIPPGNQAELEIIVNSLRAAYAIKNERRVAVIEGVLEAAIQRGRQARWFDLPWT